MGENNLTAATADVTANRNYKDTLFRMIFKEKKELLSLYNAVHGTTYDNPEDLEIVTLENAVYMRMKNDLAFVIDFQLYLYEHQSTYNPNMPLRNLFYVAKTYETLIDKSDLYRAKLIKIPNPEFVVFYNGTTERPECEERLLSEAYEHSTDSPNLELRVKVININVGKNAELMRACKTLDYYSQFVEKVRLYRTEYNNLAEAISLAIDECIREGILAYFLTKYRNEVFDVCLFEYDEEAVRKLLQKDAYEEGLEAGRIEGAEIGRRDGMITLLRTLTELVKDGIITKEMAAARINMTLDEYIQAVTTLL